MAGPARRVLSGCAIGALVLALGPACSKDQGSEAAFCRQITQVPALASVVSGFSGADAGELDTRLDDARRSFDDLRKAAPDDIADDVDAMVGLVDAVIDAVRDNGDDPEAAASQLQASLREHKDAERAALRVTAYAARHCKVELDPTVPGDASSTTTTPTATSSDDDPSGTTSTAGGG